MIAVLCLSCVLAGFSLCGIVLCWAACRAHALSEVGK